MKRIALILLSLAFIWGCGGGDNNSGNEGNQDSTGTHVDSTAHDHDTGEADADLPDVDANGNFGGEVDGTGAQPVASLPELMEGQDSMEVTLTGTVTEVCQKKGCWMNMTIAEGQDLMIRFKDYGFFVPRNCSGKTATMSGMAKREVIEVDELRHYAEDAGKSTEEIEAITEPEERLTFLASGVIIEAPAETPAE